MSMRIQAAADDMGFDSAEDLVAMLKVHGLSIATAEERAVLDACAAWTIARSAKRSDGSYTDYWGSVEEIYEAELARREVKR